MCVEFKLAIWGFDNGKMKMTSPLYQLHRPIEMMKVTGEYIYMVFEQGESCYLLYNEQDQLCKADYDRSNEHEDSVVSIDVHHEKGLIVTADSDGLIKVWNSNKELQREIKFNEDIASVCFMNNAADLLIGHGG
jgi:WD40 repeat protein